MPPLKKFKYHWALLAPLSLSVLSAQQVYDGSGDWNLTNLNWNAGSAWINGSDAVFQAPGTTLSLSENIQAGNLHFEAPYTLNGGNTLALAPNASFDVSGAGNVVQFNPILSASDLSKIGDGTLLLSNQANQITGNVTIQSGAIQATHGNSHALGTASYLINPNGTLRLDIKSTGTQTVSNAITGSGRLQLTFDNVSGDTVLGNLQDFAGTIDLQTPTSTGNKLRLDTGDYQSAININPNAQLFLSANSTITIQQGITLSGTGNTENRGAIRSGSSTLNANLTLVGSTTLGYEGNNTLNGDITSGAAGTQVLTLGTPNSGGNVSHNGVIGGGLGTISLVSRTSNALLTGNNTYTGGTSVQTGSVTAHIANGHNALGTGAVSIDSGAKLVLQRSTNSGATNFANQLSGSGDLELHFASGGTVRDTYLNNIQNFSGKITLVSNAGTTGDKLNLAEGTYQNAFEIRNNAQLFLDSATTIQGGITLAGNGNTENFGAIRLHNTLNANLTLSDHASIGPVNNSVLNGNVSAAAGSTKTFSFGTSNTAANLEHNGVLENGAGTLAITHNGSGRTTLNGNNTFTGGVKIQRGTLVLGNAGALNSSAPNTLEVSGGALELNGNSVTVSTLRGTSQGSIRNENANGVTLTVRQTENSTYSGTISDGNGGGSLSLVKSGSGVLTLRDSQSTYTGTTSIQEGTLRLAAAPLTPVSGAVFHLDAQNASTLSINADGSGAVTSGTQVGRWSDSSGNSNHFLQLNADQKPTYQTNQINGHAALVFDGASSPNNDRLVLDAATQVQSVFILNRPDNLGGLDGLLGANGADFGIRAQSSTAWQTPGNTNDFSNLAGSILRVNGGNNTFANQQPQILEVIRSSAYDFNTGIAIGDYWNSSQYDRVYSGAIGEILAYSTELTSEQRDELTAYLNYKWFGIQTTENLLPTSTHVEIGANAKLHLDGIDQRVASLSGAQGSAVEISQGNTLTLDGGSSTQTHTFAGVISGDGGVVKTGKTHQVLTGQNTYSGPTQVQDGNLQVGVTGQGSLQSQVTVASGGTLSGTGTIQQNVLLAGGHLSAGDQGGEATGQLTIEGDLLFGAGSTGSWKLTTANQGSAPGNDHVNVLGSVSFSESSLLDLDFTGYTAVYGDVFDLMDFLLYDNPSVLPEFQITGGQFGALFVDTSMFSVNGTISIAPEPSRLLLASAAFSVLLLRRRRSMLHA